MNPSIRHLVLIDTASRLATRIINGRRTSFTVPITDNTTPAQIEAFRTQDSSERIFHRIVDELQIHDNK